MANILCRLRDFFGEMEDEEEDEEDAAAAAEWGGSWSWSCGGDCADVGV